MGLLNPSCPGRGGTAQQVGCGHRRGRPLQEVKVTPWWDSCPPSRRWEVWPHPAVGGPCGRAKASGTGGGGGGRPAQTLLLPFYGLTVSEAALTRTSAIRLPRCLGPETRGGGARGGAGEQWERRVPWEEGEGSEPRSRKMPPLQGRP